MLPRVRSSESRLPRLTFERSEPLRNLDLDPLYSFKKIQISGNSILFGCAARQWRFVRRRNDTRRFGRRFVEPRKDFLPFVIIDLGTEGESRSLTLRLTGYLKILIRYRISIGPNIDRPRAFLVKHCDFLNELCINVITRSPMSLNIQFLIC